ncbi:protein tlpB [Flavobacterium paronense]|uniref:MauE/DoxX family redox-associated membrane protein n=1 Tax=Flavobacterium paronense TaxID=1392775 RepID=A0ABV5GGQ8_9FLAO|nr:MauE/DoxX family redox-associated membrane protein [Flavobacterium paronense]MDN3676588.1 protein tlpB [Flavobacterium paronense]
MTKETQKSYIAWTLRIIVAVLFILSALAKLSKGNLLDSPYFAISTFEVKQLYTLGFSEGFAPYFSRTLIGIELALGLLLLQNNWLRKFIVPVTTLLLLVFIGHLSYVTFLSGGNTGNCGCFGELLPMTPIEAIIKNIVAVGLLAYLFVLLPKEAKDGNFWILTTVLFATILAIYMLAPIQPPASNFQISTPQETTNDSLQEKSVDTIAAIFSKDTIKKVETIKTDVKKEINEPEKHKSGYASYFSKIDIGRKTLCFFVPGCDHCRVAAKELTALKQKDKNFPEISIIFMNEEADLIPDFFKEAGAEYPYKIIEVIPFWKVLGSGKDTPGVKYLWNGNEYKYYWGITDNKFDPEDYRKLINKPFTELEK